MLHVNWADVAALLIIFSGAVLVFSRPPKKRYQANNTMEDKW